MKVLVVGASGRIGRSVTESLLEAGHEVTAFARRPEALGLGANGLRHFAGDAFSQADVAQAVEGQEAVVVTLGSGTKRHGTVRSQGTLNVIHAMQAQGVRRLVVQSTLGAHESRDNLNFWWRRVMFGLLLKQVHADHELQESFVRASGLDWTIVRPSAFVDGPATGRFEAGFGPEVRGLRLKIATGDIAAFLRGQVSGRGALGQAVSIST